MPLSRSEASDALRDIRKTERRAFSAYGYRAVAPYLMLWGVVWFAGYGGTDLWPWTASWLWPAVTLLGFLLSAAMGMSRKTGKAGQSSAIGWRIVGTWLIVALFIVGAIVLLKPKDGAQIGAFIALLVGATYGVIGLWGGARLAVAGFVICALTLAGYYTLHAHFGLWMAVVGGGTLMLSGLWLTKA